jgi:hypothetical protein
MNFSAEDIIHYCQKLLMQGVPMQSIDMIYASKLVQLTVLDVNSTC